MDELQKLRLKRQEAFVRQQCAHGRTPQAQNAADLAFKKNIEAAEIPSENPDARASDIALKALDIKIRSRKLQAELVAADGDADTPPASDTQAGQDASVVAEPDLPKRVRSVDALNGLIEDAVFEVGTGASVASVSTVLFQWALDDAKPGRLLADTTDDILRFRDGRFTKEVKEKALKQRIRRYLKHQGS